jgi:hypothetical protein
MTVPRQAYTTSWSDILNPEQSGFLLDEVSISDHYNSYSNNTSIDMSCPEDLCTWCKSSREVSDVEPHIIRAWVVGGATDLSNPQWSKPLFIEGLSAHQTKEVSLWFSKQVKEAKASASDSSYPPDKIFHGDIPNLTGQPATLLQMPLPHWMTTFFGLTPVKGEADLYQHAVVAAGVLLKNGKEIPIEYFPLIYDSISLNQSNLCAAWNTALQDGGHILEDSHPKGLHTQTYYEWDMCTIKSDSYISLQDAQKLNQSDWWPNQAKTLILRAQYLLWKQKMDVAVEGEEE